MKKTAKILNKITNISTKTGDAGESSLANGQRLSKSQPIFAVLGDLDELNAQLGLVVAMMAEKDLFSAARQFLLDLQNQLMLVSAELAGAPKVTVEAQVLHQLEQESEALQTQLADHWQNHFLLPGGSVLAAQLDIARTVCRRAERSLVALLESGAPVRPILLQLLNRLSDYLYVLRVMVNWQLQKKEAVFRQSLPG